MRNNSLEKNLNRLHGRTLGVILLLTVLIHVFLLFFEVRKVTGGFFDILLKQVTTITLMNTQVGDLISLQKHLESLSTPVSEALPVAVTVRRESDQKLLVNSQSDNFRAKSFFRHQAESKFPAHPFGDLVLSAEFDYTPLVVMMLLKMVITCVLVALALLATRLYVSRIHHDTLFPLDRLSDWLATLSPEALKRGTTALPGGVADSSPLALGLDLLVRQINELSRLIADAEIQRKLAAIAAQVAHDIRSPLSALKVLSGQLDGLPGDQKSLMLRSIERIETIANDMLAERKAAGPDNSVSLNALIAPVIEEKRLEFSNRSGVKICFTPGADISVGDLGLEIPRIISNLINNSVASLTDTGEVQVAVRLHSDSFAISVVDDGAGINPEILRLLQSGVAISHRPSTIGNGLGLSHAREVVAKVGGRLDIQSRPGHGTIVTLVIPRAP